MPRLLHQAKREQGLDPDLERARVRDRAAEQVHDTVVDFINLAHARAKLRRVRAGDDDLNQRGRVDSDVERVVREQPREIINLLGIGSERGALGLAEREQHE